MSRQLPLETWTVDGQVFEVLQKVSDPNKLNIRVDMQYRRNGFDEPIWLPKEAQSLGEARLIILTYLDQTKE